MEVGKANQSPYLSKAGKAFKALAIVCFCSLFLFVLSLIVVNVFVLDPIRDFAEHPDNPVFIIALVSSINVIYPVLFLQAGIGIAISSITHAAWEQLDATLAGEPASNTKESGSFQIARVIKGSKLSLAGNILLIPFIGSVAYLLFSLYQQIRWGGTPIPGIIEFFVIALIVSALLSIISGLAGMINQAVGLFNFGKNIGANPSIAKRLLSDGAEFTFQE